MINPVYPTVISNTVTAGNLLADTTTDNAFIAPVGIDFSRYRGDFIEIYSGTTLWAQAWISETAPGGESLDSELVTNGDMELDSNWPSVESPQVNERSNEQVHAGSYSRKFTSATSTWRGGVYQNIGATSGGLYYSNFWHYSFTPSYYIGYQIANDQGAAMIKSSTNAWGEVVAYTTATGSSAVFSAYDANRTYYIDDVSVKRVTSPASTGALLLSSNGGSRGWAYKHASFDPNAAVTLRILARRIASGNGGYYK